MTNHIWMSNLTVSAPFAWFEPYIAPGEDKAAVSKKYARSSAFNRVGRALSAEDLPPITRATRRKPKQAKHVAVIQDRLIVVSDKLADVLRDFDLGDGGLFPTKLVWCGTGGIEDLPVTVFYWNFGNTKRCLNPEASQNVRLSPSPREGLPDTYGPLETHHDDDVALRPECIEGPDVWVDPGYFVDLFISNRLAVALREASLDEGFGLVRCRVV